MKQITPNLVATVRTALKGKKLEKFDASIAILNESLAQGGWTTRGSVKVNSGFYQGIANVDFSVGYKDGKPIKGHEEASMLMFCLRWGHDMEEADVAIAYPFFVGRSGFKLSLEVVKAWAALCNERFDACDILDEARPLPVITAIGLSPKVTKTLTECNLDLDLPSIKMAKLEARERPAFKWNKKTEKSEPVMCDDGTQATETYYVVVWSDGIEHNMSRFCGGCQACGKNIPSGRYVPIEAQDKKSGKLISMWLGCDCAKNIFGVKDIGVERAA